MCVCVQCVRCLCAVCVSCYCEENAECRVKCQMPSKMIARKMPSNVDAEKNARVLLRIILLLFLFIIGKREQQTTTKK